MNELGEMSSALKTLQRDDDVILWMLHEVKVSLLNFGVYRNLTQNLYRVLLLAKYPWKHSFNAVFLPILLK